MVAGSVQLQREAVECNVWFGTSGSIRYIDQLGRKDLTCRLMVTVNESMGEPRIWLLFQ